MKQMKVDIDKKYSTIESKVEALEKQMSTVKGKLTQKIKVSRSRIQHKDCVTR